MITFKERQTWTLFVFVLVFALLLVFVFAQRSRISALWQPVLSRGIWETVAFLALARPCNNTSPTKIQHLWGLLLFRFSISLHFFNISLLWHNRLTTTQPQRSNICVITPFSFFTQPQRHTSRPLTVGQNSQNINSHNLTTSNTTCKTLNFGECGAVPRGLCLQ